MAGGRPTTTIKDSQGQEILEGSILASPNWWWGNCFVYLNRGESGPCKGDSVMSYILAKDIHNPLNEAVHNIWNGRDVTVVGHIDTNPELIGQNKQSFEVVAGDGIGRGIESLTNRPLLADENGVPLVPIRFYSPPGVI